MQRPPREQAAPELPGDNVHVTLDADKLGLGFLQDLVGRLGEARNEVHEIRSILTALKYQPHEELRPEQQEAGND